jgi:hypothetical protein
MTFLRNETFVNVNKINIEKKKKKEKKRDGNDFKYDGETEREK